MVYPVIPVLEVLSTDMQIVEAHWPAKQSINSRLRKKSCLKKSEVDFWAPHTCAHTQC